jgi:hypothetical protein
MGDAFARGRSGMSGVLPVRGGVHRCGPVTGGERNIMGYEALQTYMRDHLAGSVVGIKELERLESGAEDTDERQAFASLRQEVEEDRAVLTRLLEAVGGGPSTIREAGARVTDFLTAVKLRTDDPGGRRLEHFERLEGLALGILGKRALWRALGAAAPAIPEFGGTDFDRLAARAQDQHDRVETRRIAAARGLTGD